MNLKSSHQDKISFIHENIISNPKTSRIAVKSLNNMSKHINQIINKFPMELDHDEKVVFFNTAMTSALAVLIAGHFAAAQVVDYKHITKNFSRTIVEILKLLKQNGTIVA